MAPTQFPTPIIGVAGVGVVGGAVFSYFEANGLHPIAYDKYQGVGTAEDLDRASMVFICVPTPYHPTRGLDTSGIEDVLSGLKSGKTVVVKSTMLPGSTEALAQRYPEQTVLFNPEFLREKTAEDDFLHPDRQIVGYCPGGRAQAELALSLLPPAPFSEVVSATEAEMIKVATNSFLALKVSFANEIYDFCNRLGADYEAVKAGLYADARVGASHFDVFDGGYRGYGGKCLPKDSMALLDMANREGIALELINAAALINTRLLDANATDGLSEKAAA